MYTAAGDAEETAGGLLGAFVMSPAAGTMGTAEVVVTALIGGGPVSVPAALETGATGARGPLAPLRSAATASAVPRTPRMAAAKAPVARRQPVPLMDLRRSEEPENGSASPP